MLLAITGQRRCIVVSRVDGDGQEANARVRIPLQGLLHLAELAAQRLADAGAAGVEEVHEGCRCGWVVQQRAEAAATVSHADDRGLKLTARGRGPAALFKRPERVVLRQGGDRCCESNQHQETRCNGAPQAGMPTRMACLLRPRAVLSGPCLVRRMPRASGVNHAGEVPCRPRRAPCGPGAPRARLPPFQRTPEPLNSPIANGCGSAPPQSAHH